MESEKVFDATIDVPNPIGFCTDRDTHLMRELQNKFVDRCYKGALVLRIVRVIKAGACCINTSNGAGEGYIDVQFLAAVRVFAQWEILTNVQVRDVTQFVSCHYMAGGSARAFVILDPKRGGAALAPGQTIAVRVLKADHPPREAAVVYGVLLTCDRAAPTYKVREALDAQTAADLVPMVDQISTELALREELQKTRGAQLDFFEALLYAHRQKGAAPQVSVAAWEGGPEWVGPAAAETKDAVSVVDVVRRAAAGAAVPVAGLWSRPLTLYRSSPLATFAPRVSGAPRGEAPEAITEPPKVVFALMLKNILDFLVATRELAAIYDDPAADPKYAGIWAAMRQAQV